MISKLEIMNMHEENTKTTPEIAEPQKESEKVLIQMKETPNGHKDVNLSEIFKEKEKIKVRIADFNIDCVLYEETGEYYDIENLGNPGKTCYDSFIRRNKLV
jgi:hypothetical protein